MNYNKIMSEQFHPPFPVEPNPLTQRQHRKEVLWQITLPLAIGVLLVLAAGIGVGYAGASKAGPVDRWASISTIWLIIPMMAVALIFLAVTAALAYGLMRLNALLPRYTRQFDAQRQEHTLSRWVHRHVGGLLVDVKSLEVAPHRVSRIGQSP